METIIQILKAGAGMFLLMLIYFGPFILISSFMPGVEFEDDEEGGSGNLGTFAFFIAMFSYGVYEQSNFHRSHKNIEFTAFWVISSIAIFVLAGIFAFTSEPAELTSIPLIKTAFVVLIVSGVFAFVETYFPETINKLFKLLNPK